LAVKNAPNVLPKTFSELQTKTMMTVTATVTTSIITTVVMATVTAITIVTATITQIITTTAVPASADNKAENYFLGDSKESSALFEKA